MNRAGTVEILRAAQKDDSSVDKLREQIQNFVEEFYGQRFVLKWKRYIGGASVAAYYVFTNLTGNQTLGEEYAGLVQTDKSLRKIPSKLQSAAMILFMIYGSEMFEKMGNYVVERVDRWQRNNAGDSNQSTVNLSLDPREVWSVLRHWIPWLLKLHTVVFYLQGRFFHVSKRFAGIRYVLVRRWFANQDDNSLRNLKYLRWMSIINLVLFTFNEYAKTRNTALKAALVKQASTENSSSGQPCDNSEKCSLCLEKRREPSLTPCGHLFCWTCILDWLQAKEECPICRTEVTKSRVIPLQNHT